MEQKKKLYPFKLIPYTIHRAWGEERWDVADMGIVDSVISDGWLEGNTLSDIMETYLERVVGEGTYNYYGRQFPILVKSIDIKDRTPLQVHPDDEIAEQRYDALGKTELIYIISAEPGARLYLGFNRDVSAMELYERCLNGTVEEVLNEITPHKGDCYIIKPGTVHCTSGSMKIAGIQESSDLGFTLYDWLSCGHEEIAEDLSEAMDFIDYGKYSGEGAIRPEGHEIAEKLSECMQFQITKIKLSDALHIYTEKFESFIIYTCIEGEASIQVPVKDADGKEKMESHILKKSESILIPAETPDFFVVPVDRSTILLESTAGVLDDKDSYINPDTEPFLEDEDYEGLEDEDYERLEDEENDEGHHCCGHNHN